jgi:hypothetical protein
MPERFNEAQQSRIQAGVNYIEKLLTDAEQILSASSFAEFPKFKHPLPPAQARVARDYLRRLRQQIVSVLTDCGVPLPEARFESIHAIRVTLQFIEVAIEELAPARLAGCGDVPEALISVFAAAPDVLKFADDLNRLLLRPKPISRE